MDQPDTAPAAESGRITLTPDMRPMGTKDAPTRDSQPSEKPRRASRWPAILATLGLLAGIGGVAAAFWVYWDGQTEIRRLASEVAELRVSLDLYARGTQTAQAAPADTSALDALSDRVATLEANARNAPALPAAPAPTADAASSQSDGDCLPTGMRILVAQGDNYPICGQSAELTVGQVANGYIVLSDGTAIPSGGTMPLPGSACNVAVTSGGDEGLTGYAEIRVTC